MFIAIEGLDGVGKTTTAKMVADKLGFSFVDKPLHYLFDEQGYDNYIRIRDIINESDNRVLTAWFYGLSNIYCVDKYKGQNIVTDRHFLSNYAWSGTAENKEIYDILVKLVGMPDLTVILFADDNTICQRLNVRNATDKDLKKVSMSQNLYGKMRIFCAEYKLSYIEINTSKMSLKEVVDVIAAKVTELKI
ncbi:MAG: AAA family ATPase [Bacteroidales bacterium]|nr:AAA family ATPase [Bacteroidales bacterium]